MIDPSVRWPDPAELLTHLEITQPHEIDVEAIGELCGATILYEPLRGCEARLVGRGDRAIIVVNSTVPAVRRRFSAAHELGHWMHDRRDQGFACAEWMMPGARYRVDGYGMSSQEERANRWAADLLLPDAMLARRQAKTALTYKKVREVARRFRTSLTATALRLLEQSYAGSMIIHSRLDRRWKWFQAGRAVPHRLWPNDEPGPETVAYGLLRGSRNNPGPTEVGSDGWIDRSDGWWYPVVEDSLRIRRGEVLSLLTWVDRHLFFRTKHFRYGPWMPWQPKISAKKLLVERLCSDWDYRRRDASRGRVILTTDEPSPHTLVIPAWTRIDGAKLRAAIAEVARHKKVSFGQILESLEDRRYRRW